MRFLLCVIVALWGVLGVRSAAPAPTQDCSTVILNLADCLSYVTSVTVQKPEAGCCSGLETVLQTAPECICETFKNSGQLGISLNMTRALSVPSACGIKAPPFITLAPPPAPSPPGHSPKRSSKAPKTPSPSSALPLAPTLPPSGSSDAPSSSVSAGGPGQSLPKSGASAIRCLLFFLLV